MTETEQTDWRVTIAIMVFLDHDLCYIVLKLQTLALIQLRDHISFRMHGMVGVVKQSQVIILNQLFCNCGGVFICVNAALYPCQNDMCNYVHIAITPPPKYSADPMYQAEHQSACIKPISFNILLSD